MKQLAAGVARTDITPPLGLVHPGWGGRTHQQVIGIDLPLWATALALSDGEQTLVIVDIDHAGLPGPVATQIRTAIADSTGLPVSNIRLSYTHTHSGVRSGSRWGTIYEGPGSEMLEPYEEDLRHKIEGVAWGAVRDLRPARIGAGRGTSRISVNRRFVRPEDGAMILGRNWDGPVDDEVQVLRIDTKTGEPLAAIVHYACHGVTVGPDCDLVTPDFPGVMKRVVEETSGATCLFLQGAAGNVHPRRGVARGGINEYKRLGQILGHAASSVWWDIEVPPRQERFVGTFESGGPIAIYVDEPVDAVDSSLRVRTRSISLPLKEFPAPEGLEAEFQRHLARTRELYATGGSEEEIRWEAALTRRASFLATMARESQGQTHVAFELQAFVIGQEIVLVAMPGEPYVEIALEIKRNSPFKYTLFSGYSNAGHGYIPTADAYPLGGYEVEFGTPFTPDAAGQVIQESLALLHELAG